ncbi:MAG: ion transporter [Oligoflexia bacterium]|nr:ion transporter [Oligoflexia bacterium]MBF0365516.1 ion transporter [Oligoflexia bacterium]
MIVLEQIVESRAFKILSLLVILLGAIVVGAETIPGLRAEYSFLLMLIDQLVIAYFVFEMVIRILAKRKPRWHFFKDGWNVFDFFIIAGCLLPAGGPFFSVLRLARVLRVLRVLTMFPRLQILVISLLKSFSSIGYIGLLLLLQVYVFGVLGVFTFGANDPIHFGDLGRAFLTLFQVLTLEGWVDIMKIQMLGCNIVGYEQFTSLCTHPEANPAAAVAYFVSFIVLGTMVVLNLFIGVVTSGIQQANEEMKLLSA